MKSSTLWAAALAIVGATALGSCGDDSSHGGNSPTTPSPGTGGSGTVTINIVGTQGNKAFVPNPVQAAAGDTLMWKNSDTVTHHIVMDDGSVDIGDIVPGASRTSQLKGSGGNYHCTIHTSMVGSINGATAPTPPCPDIYC